jgi:TonB family protein
MTALHRAAASRNHSFSLRLMLPERSPLRYLVLDLIILLAMACACSTTTPAKPGSDADGLTRLDPDEPNDAWLIDVQKEIYEIWLNNAPKGIPGRVVAGVTVGSDGQLLDVKVLESSGVLALDEYAVEAIRTAAPFPRFPRSMSGDVKSFRTRFDYGGKREEGSSR